MAGTLKQIDLDKIFIQPGFNIRHTSDEGIDALATSINSIGLKNPIIVMEEGDGWKLLAGHRRTRAIKVANDILKAGIEKIPAIVHKRMPEADQMLLMMSDSHSRPLTPLEMAEGISRLTKICGMSRTEVAQKFGISYVDVMNKETLANAPEPVKAAVRQGKISATEATEVLKEHSSEEAQIIVSEAVSIAEEEAPAKGKPARATRKTVQKAKAKLGRGVASKTRGRSTGSSEASEGVSQGKLKTLCHELCYASHKLLNALASNSDIPTRKAQLVTALIHAKEQGVLKDLTLGQLQELMIAARGAPMESAEETAEKAQEAEAETVEAASKGARGRKKVA